MTAGYAAWVVMMLSPPLVLAQSQGVDLHVWIDGNSRQNALADWLLTGEGISHDPIPGSPDDLMAEGMADMLMVYADCGAADGSLMVPAGIAAVSRTARTNHVPVYALLPVTRIDTSAADVKALSGSGSDEMPMEAAEAGLVSAIVTDRGACPANASTIARLIRQASLF